MNLSVTRFSLQQECSIGHLELDGEDSGLFTLEPKTREVVGQPVASWKVPGKTAIPRGTYQVIVDHSEHFGEDLPHILDVPGFEGVRIHPGNTDLATEGCVLVGTNWTGGDFIAHSRDAFNPLFAKIKAAIASGEKVEITVA